MNKKVSIGAKPKARSADEWVGASGGGQAEPKAGEETKRLTIDVPKSLHRKFKSKCADEDRKMNEVMIEWIEKYISKS